MQRKRVGAENLNDETIRGNMRFMCAEFFLLEFSHAQPNRKVVLRQTRLQPWNEATGGWSGGLRAVAA
jgi:hypothetical protein